MSQKKLFIPKLAQASLRDRFKLTNLLLKPIQHVSQYSVILEELRKYIPEVARLIINNRLIIRTPFSVNLLIAESRGLQWLEIC